jgi:hypothetical protein
MSASSLLLIAIFVGGLDIFLWRRAFQKALVNVRTLSELLECPSVKRGFLNFSVSIHGYYLTRKVSFSYRFPSENGVVFGPDIEMKKQPEKTSFFARYRHHKLTNSTFRVGNRIYYLLPRHLFFFKEVVIISREKFQFILDELTGAAEKVESSTS